LKDEFSIIDQFSMDRVSCRQYGNSELSFIVIETLDIEGDVHNPIFSNSYWVYCGVLPPYTYLADIFLEEFLEGYSSENRKTKQNKDCFRKYKTVSDNQFEWEVWSGIDGVLDHVLEFAKSSSDHLLYKYPKYLRRVIKILQNY
jgi:hypothetical protein